MTISGTRLTLYDVMDFLKAQYPPQLIRDKFNLTDDQIDAALSSVMREENRADSFPVLTIADLDRLVNLTIGNAVLNASSRLF